ncbi:5-formyltetrahydrofolate cyclo-ligase, partial [Pelagibacterales bacterium SAG-MED07]|nr:5-formyltetrahydrofolate cyclo-ligase [Pelagibacterales bacterium SAG-MED07]
KKKILTIGLAYSFQKVREIPIDEHDTKLDFIITDKEN